MFIKIKNKKGLSTKIRLVVFIILLLCLIIVAYIPYINLLFPLWVDIILTWVISIYLFKIPFKGKGIIVLLFWVFSYIILITGKEAFAESVSIATYILFAFFVIENFKSDL